MLSNNVQETELSGRQSLVDQDADADGVRVIDVSHKIGSWGRHILNSIPLV